MNRTPVISSHIASIGYENGVLEIAWRDGRVYWYYHVPLSVYLELMAAPSKGHYFNRCVKPWYIVRRGR